MSVVDLIIVGAGGGSREILSTALDANDRAPAFRVLGFVDDDEAKHGREVLGYPVLGPLELARDRKDAKVIVGIAHWQKRGIRKAIVERLGVARDRYASVIHPSAQISRFARIGPGSHVQASCVVTADSIVGDHAFIGAATTLSHDDTLEDFVTLAGAVVVCGGVRIGESSYVGARSVLMSHVTIGKGALVGLGSVVLGDVGPGATVYGNPAKPAKPEARTP